MSESGRQSALAVTKTPSSPRPSTPQFDDTVVPLSERHNTSTQSVTKAACRAAEPAKTYCQPVQRPPSASSQRPPSAAGRHGRAVRHNISDSYVDESLFGPAIDSTPAMLWQPKQRPVKPFIFDCTDYKAKAKASPSTNVVPSSRPSSQRSRPRSARPNTQPSYVDESLFGDQLELSTWRAPWDKKDCRPRPLIFDATNYREKQQRTSNTDDRLQRASSAKRAATRQVPPWR